MRLPDPTHQRANGNLKYFEVQLEKQRRAETSAGGDKREKRHVDAQMKRSEDPLPERKRYEQLCRGEGLKMVRTQHLYVIVLCFFFIFIFLSHCIRPVSHFLPCLRFGGITGRAVIGELQRTV